MKTLRYLLLAIFYALFTGWFIQKALTHDGLLQILYFAGAVLEAASANFFMRELYERDKQ